MSIVNSEISQAIDIGYGNTFVVEKHTGSDGLIYDIRYVAGPGVDTDEKLAAHRAELNNQLAVTEADRILSE